ncbi:MAG: O-antigen ligase family protein [Bacteroidales bacterium]|nr:O-antigen ligase family protein [Bacteroidales bacterium]
MMKPSTRSLLIALSATALFLAANTVCLAKDLYWVSLIPVGLLATWLFVCRLETGLMAMAMLTPLALDVTLMPGMELSMPVEPMMILFSGIFLFRTLVDRTFDSRILRHPISLAILAQLVWMLITSATSTLPAVSFKYLAARLWFVIPFYFAAVQIFRNYRRIRQFYWSYAIGLAFVILYATVGTLNHLHDLQTLHRVMCPFYNDHTAYGCVIALFLPAAIYFLLDGSWRSRLKLPVAAFVGLLCIGLFFSYCRAGWLSILAAIGVYALIRLGMKLKWMVLLFALGVGGFFAYQGDIMYKMGKNKQDSSLDLAGQIQSISNISTDASNLERLNRWASALRMFKEHPALGCGPGTYQFLYASYQRSYQKSVISTDFGNRGNAHSEYIGPLTDQGVPGLICVLAVFLITFATGVRIYRTSPDPQVARMALAFTLSLLTYYVHGVFNNFLDTDKLSVPFWAFTAVITSLDLYSHKQ